MKLAQGRKDRTELYRKHQSVLISYMYEFIAVR